MPRRAWIALVAVVLLAAPAQAGQKTTVTVKFVVDTYREYLSDADRAGLEAKVAARIAARLRTLVPYFDYTDAAQSDPTRSFLLRIRLAKPAPTGSTDRKPGEVGLYLDVQGPRVGQDSQYIVFRTADDLRSVVAGEALVQEIDGRLPESVYAGAITRLLVQVPIAQMAGRVIFQPASGWILPYRVSEICLDFGSKVEIESRLPGPVGMRTTQRLKARASGSFERTDQADLSPLVGNIFTEPLDAPAFQQEMAGANATQVLISAIWILERETAAECVR